MYACWFICDGFSHYLNVDGCENVPKWINDEVSSIDTHGSCISGCEKSDCRGECAQFFPGSAGHEDVSLVNMDKKLTSFKPCTM